MSWLTQRLKLSPSVTTYLLARTFSIYLIVTILLTGVQMLLHYQQTEAYLAADRGSLQKTLDPHIRHSLQTLNYDSLEVALEGLLTNPAVIGVKVTGPQGETLFAGGIHHDAQGQWTALKGIRNFLKNLPTDFQLPELIGRPIELTSRYRLEGRLIGALHLFADQRPAFERVRRDFTLILINAAIKTLVIWAVFIYFARILISRPLRDLAAAAQKVDFKNPELVLADFSAPYENELKLLGDTFNRMSRRLYQDFLTTQRLQRNLTEQNKDLEDTVEARTLELDEKNHQLEEALENLQLFHQQMVDSIHYAHRLQQAVLPHPERLKEILPESYWFSEAKEIVGGDFYYLWTEPQYLVLGIFDCTGHGIPGALMTMTAATVLRHILADGTALGPAEIFKQLDRGLRDALQKSQQADENDEGLDGALLVVHWSQRRLVFAGAHLPLAYMDPEGPLVWLNGTRQSVGYHSSQEPLEITEQVLELKPGRRYYLFTDGCFDQKGGISGFPMGKGQWRSWLEETRPYSLAEQARRLEQLQSQWSLGRGTTDDRSLLVFELP
ncbi:MAG: SpoIIE family protein phosphatase [bacterium]|nr:SpoIIE family protein phosphatase [bacterium]